MSQGLLALKLSRSHARHSALSPRRSINMTWNASAIRPAKRGAEMSFAINAARFEVELSLRKARASSAAGMPPSKSSHTRRRNSASLAAPAIGRPAAFAAINAFTSSCNAAVHGNAISRALGIMKRSTAREKGSITTTRERIGALSAKQVPPGWNLVRRSVAWSPTSGVVGGLAEAAVSEISNARSTSTPDRAHVIAAVLRSSE